RRGHRGAAEKEEGCGRRVEGHGAEQVRANPVWRPAQGACFLHDSASRRLGLAAKRGLSFLPHFELHHAGVRNRLLNSRGATTAAAARALLAAGPGANRAAQHVQRGDGDDQSDSDELRVDHAAIQVPTWYTTSAAT